MDIQKKTTRRTSLLYYNTQPPPYYSLGISQYIYVIPFGAQFLLPTHTYAYIILYYTLSRLRCCLYYAFAKRTLGVLNERGENREKGEQTHNVWGRQYRRRVVSFFFFFFDRFYRFYIDCCARLFRRQNGFYTLRHWRTISRVDLSLFPRGNMTQNGCFVRIRPFNTHRIIRIVIFVLYFFERWWTRKSSNGRREVRSPSADFRRATNQQNETKSIWPARAGIMFLFAPYRLFGLKTPRGRYSQRVSTLSLRSA